jgi:pheromone alpha factor receptor
MADAPPDPRKQIFYIKAANGSDVAVSMEAIEAQRVRLANVSINYGVQLGLCLLALIVVVMLLPTLRMRRPLNLVQLTALVIAVVRLVLLVLYFPSPLTAYAVVWTHDTAGVLAPSDFVTIIVSNGFGAVQFALIETALVLQSWALIRTWRVPQLPVLFLSVAIAITTVVVKVLWVVHYYFYAVRGGGILPIPLDTVGKTAVVLGAVSILYFEGIFVAHVSSHLLATHGMLKPSSERRGLTSLEVLAIGNGILMILPCEFGLIFFIRVPSRTLCKSCFPFFSSHLFSFAQVLEKGKKNYYG